jgi:hypothetical protein
MRFTRIDSLTELLSWTNANRYVPELTCTEREIYHLQPGCVNESFPTSTPYVTPSSLTPTLTVPLIEPTTTPTLSWPSLVANIGVQRGEIPEYGSQRWLYHGTTGESLTIHAAADNPASSDFVYHDALGNPTLIPVIGVYHPNGLLIALSSDISTDDYDQILEDFMLPVDGDYWIEVIDYGLAGGGEYTLTIESRQATSEPTATL